MNKTEIEALPASPPDRDELVVQLFIKGGAQWAEIYRVDDVYWIDLYGAAPEPMRFPLDALQKALLRSQASLAERLEAPG